jgi:acyl carrier protein
MQATERARQLIQRCMDAPALLSTIDDDADLMQAGVNSGELILVSMECENLLGRPLTDPELSSLSTINDVAEIISKAEAGDGRR